MNLVLTKKQKPAPVEFSLIYGGLALFLLAAARFPPVIRLAPACAFRSLTGLPCPTCGSTRAVSLLSRGDFLSAFAMNPLTAAVLLAAVLAFLVRSAVLAFGLPGISLHLREREKKRMRAAAVLALVLNWLYLILCTS